MKYVAIVSMLFFMFWAGTALGRGDITNGLIYIAISLTNYAIYRTYELEEIGKELKRLKKAISDYYRATGVFKGDQ